MTNAAPTMTPSEATRWAWRQLTSMRTALLLLLLLALAAIPGSFFPQRTSGVAPVNQFLEDNPTLGRIVDSLGLFDVYGSFWFTAIYLLLLISIVGCVIPRFRQHLKAMRAAPPPPPANLSKLGGFQEIKVKGESFEAGTLGEARNANEAPVQLKELTDWLVKKRWRVVTSSTQVNSNVMHAVSAEKGYSRETGNLIFHGALIFIVVGVAIGALWGYRGQVLVREDTGFSNVIIAYDDFSSGRLFNPGSLPPFTLQLEQFRAEFERFGAKRGEPRVFEAAVSTTLGSDEAARRDTLRVNHPLNFEGTKVFLTGHGYAPRLTVTDKNGQVQFDDSLVFLPRDGNFTSIGVLKLPDAPEQIGIEAIFLPSAVLDEELGPISVFPGSDSPALFLVAWQGDLGVDAGVPQNVFQLDTSDMKRLGISSLTPGESWTLPELGTVEFDGVSRFISLQVAHEPGRQLVLGASIVALVGLLFGLFVPRRRVWVKFHSLEDGGFKVEVAGLSRQGYAGLVEEVNQTLEVVKK